MTTTNMDHLVPTASDHRVGPHRRLIRQVNRYRTLHRQIHRVLARSPGPIGGQKTGYGLRCPSRRSKCWFHHHCPTSSGRGYLRIIHTICLLATTGQTTCHQGIQATT